MRSMLLGILLACAACAACAACGAAEKAAKEDPMKCERDPKCEKKRGRQQDCSMQCNDDPACMERCETIQRPNRGLGH